MIRIHHTQQPRGMTLIEVMIAAVIITFVMVFLVYITLLQGYKSNHIATISRAESDVRNVAEFIRYRALMGKFGSMVVTNNGRTLTFNDPNSGSAIRSFTFNTQTGQLIYDDDLDNGPPAYRTFDDLRLVTFSLLNNGAILEAKVSAVATPYSTAWPKPSFTVQQSLKVFLRN